MKLQIARCARSRSASHPEVMRALPHLAMMAVVLAAGRSQALENIAHRGFSGAHPDNSRAAITNAWAAGATMVEVDVRITADQVVVLHHDPDVNDQEVATLPYDQLAALTDPPALTFSDALTCMNKSGSLLLDLKVESPTFLPRIADCLATNSIPAERIVFQSRSLNQLREVRSRFPHSRRHLLTSLDRSDASGVPPSSANLARTLVQHEIDGVTAKGRQFITRRYVQDFQHHGLLFFVWTINPPDRIAHYRRLGVDGIITDWPNRL